MNTATAPVQIAVQYLVTGHDSNGNRVRLSFNSMDLWDRPQVYTKALDAFISLQYGTLAMVADFGNGNRRSILRQKTRDGRYVKNK